MEQIIIISIIALAVVFCGVFIFLVVKNKRNKIKPVAFKFLEFYQALGGKENILALEARGSRLVVQLQDYSLYQNGKLKELGVSSLIKMSNKLTLVIGQIAQEIVADFQTK